MPQVWKWRNAGLEGVLIFVDFFYLTDVRTFASVTSFVLDSAPEVGELSLAIPTAVRLLPRVCSRSEIAVKIQSESAKKKVLPHVPLQLEPDDEAALAVLAFVRLVTAMPDGDEKKKENKKFSTNLSFEATHRLM